MPNKVTSRRASRWCRRRPTATPTPRHCSRHWAAAGGIASNSRRKTMGNDKTATIAAHGVVRLLLVATLCTLGACGSRPAEDASSATTPGNVTLTPAQRQHITLYTAAVSNYHRSIDTTGVVDFDQDHATQVLAPFSGPVRKLLVTQGDKVKSGQPLAIVTSPDFADAVATYRKAVAALDIDPHALAELRAGKDVAEVDGIIRAPLAGTVVERNITPGQLLQAGNTPCFTIANLASVWVDANVFGADAAFVRIGDTAQVHYDDNAPALSGAVTSVSAEVDPDTRATTARVAVDNPDGALKKQMYVDVRIESRQARSGLLVPVSAVLRDDDNLPFVYVVQGDDSYA